MTSRNLKLSILISIGTALGLFVLFSLSELILYWRVYSATANAAWFAIRYATSYIYDIQYCGEADQALGFLQYDTYLNSELDCIVSYAWPLDNPANVSDPFQDWLQRTRLLINHARLPSIHNATVRSANGVAPLHIVICSDKPGVVYVRNTDICLPHDDPGIPEGKAIVSLTSQYWVGSSLGLHLAMIEIHIVREGIIGDVELPAYVDFLGLNRTPSFQHWDNISP